MQRRSLLFWLLFFMLPMSCPPASESGAGREMIWATSIPLEAIEFGSSIHGAQAYAHPLVYLPLGLLVPSAFDCEALEPCVLTVPDGLADHEGRQLTAQVLADSIRSQLAGPAFLGAADELEAEVSVLKGDNGKESVRLLVGALPSRMLPYLGVARLDGDRWVGTGPYRLSISDSSSTVLQAVDESRKPRFIRIEHIEDERRILRDFLAGEIDFTTVSGRMLRLLEAAEATGDHITVSNNEVALVFNQRQASLAGSKIRRCLLAALGTSFEATRKTTRLGDPSFEPASPWDEKKCASLLEERLPKVLELELVEDLDQLDLVHEAAVAALSRLGRPVSVRWFNISEYTRPITGHMRLAGWSTTHPGFPRAWLESGAPLNSGGHDDPVLDRLMRQGEDPSRLEERLSENPAFVPIGVIPLAYVTSRRFVLGDGDDQLHEHWRILSIAAAEP